MIAQILTLTAALWVPSTGADPVACELVDLPAAEGVLGAGSMRIDGGDEPGICWYQNEASMLIVQVFDDTYFQAVRHGDTPADIGDEGRVSENDQGIVTIQFRKGENSLTITVRPNPKPDASLMDAMLAIARTAADRLP
jgi:hypothetical protein